MPQVFPGRYTNDAQGEVTVFLIGMRFNQWWRVDKWLPVFVAMPRMIALLAKHPQDGLLGWHVWTGRTVLVLQYWESPEKLQAFASAKDRPHLDPWRRYVKSLGDHPAVGIWHETYVSAPGTRESIYVNMPEFGLAGATEHVPVGHGKRTAKQRMGRKPEAS